MPKSTKPRGVKHPDKVLTNFGAWVNSKFAGLRLGKNTNMSDVHPLRKITHTSPVVRTKQNDGHTNPARIRHAATKAAHAIKRMGNVTEEPA